ncbi:MAG TPA: hypothetical protein VJ892_00495 [Candidatus Absconditabacterales bacterium]|nr:hypothetical protein [Candidatus Absconditabacterales bacterium]
MKNLLLIIMLLISSIVLSQNKRTFLVDQDTNVVVEKTQQNLKQIDLLFEENIPSLTESEISILLKDGELERFVSKTKGIYDKFILFYTPKDYYEYFYLEGNKVLYIEPYQRQQDRVFSWWFLFALLGMIAMILFQKSDNAFAVAAAFAVAVAVAAFAVAFAAFAVAAFAVAAFAANKKVKNIFAYIYYVLMILASVFVYYQI